MSLSRRVRAFMPSRSLVLVVTLAVVAMLIVVSATQMLIAYRSLSAFSADVAATRQHVAIRVAAVNLEQNEPGTSVVWSADGDVGRIVMKRFPEYTDNVLVDEISRVTGDTTTVFAFAPETGAFVRKTTSVRKADGSRAINTILDKSGPAQQALAAGNAYYGSADILGEHYYTVYLPIFSPDNRIVGALYSGVKKKVIDGNIDAWLSSVGGVSLLVLLAFSAAAVLIARWMLSPLSGLAASVNAISSGDLSAAVPHAGRGDEIGRLACALENFRQNLSDAPRRLKAEQEAIRASAEETRRREMAALADDFEKTIGGVVSRIGGAVGQLQATAETLTGAAETTEIGMGRAVNASQQALRHVGSVANAAGDLDDAIREVAAQANQSSATVRKAETEVERTSGNVQALSQSADRIGNIVGLIGEIAAQTNMLALNATIEAARAGDAGRGFAIVAQEVKALAEQTARAANDIAAQIDEIQASTHHAADSIGAIVDKIRDINVISATIASAVEQQGASTQAISRSAEEASSGATEVTESISGLSKLAKESSWASSQVGEAVGALSQQTRTLSDEVQRFLGDVRAA